MYQSKTGRLCGCCLALFLFLDLASSMAQEQLISDDKRLRVFRDVGLSFVSSNKQRPR